VFSLALGKEAAVGPAELLQGFGQPSTEGAGVAARRTSSAAPLQCSKMQEQQAGDEARHNRGVLRAENVMVREGSNFSVFPSSKKACVGPAES